MSSKIKVDTIENVAGSGNVSLGSGHNLVVPGTLNITGASTLTGALTASGGIANAGTITAGTVGSSVVFPAGHLIQKVSTKFNTAFTSSSQSFTDVTGASITFTPKSASSLLYIMFNCSMNVYTSGTNTNAGGIVRIVHDGSALDYHSSGNYEYYFQNDAGAGTGPNNYTRQVKIATVAAGNTNARVIKVEGRMYASPTVAMRINQASYYYSYFVVEEIMQ